MTTPPATAQDPLLRATPTHLFVSVRFLLRLLATMAVAGTVLAVVGLRTAYTQVGGPATPAGTVLTIAIAVATLVVTAAVGWGHLLRRRTLSPTRSTSTGDLA